MIVLDTTVLAYATGAEHEMQSPCRRLVRAIAAGQVSATTTVEVIQAYAHVRARRHGRTAAAHDAGRFAELLAPLLVVSESVLRDGLRVFAETTRLGSFDAVLAAATVGSGADALISADAAFAAVPGLAHLDPSDAAIEPLLQG